MPFAMSYDPNHRVLLVKFGKKLTLTSYRTMAAAVRQFVERSGMCHAIADFSGVEEFGLDLEFFRRLAQAPPVLLDQKRVLVAPSDEIFGMLRLFATHQSATGSEPMVVRTLAEALEHLGIVAPAFQPVPSK
jgi:hypothetical protein